MPSIFSDNQLNLQINERLSHVESVADSMQYDMYTLMQAEEPMECLSALTDTRNNLSLLNQLLIYIMPVFFFLPDIWGQMRACIFSL